MKRSQEEWPKLPSGASYRVSDGIVFFIIDARKTVLFQYQQRKQLVQLRYPAILVLWEIPTFLSDCELMIQAPCFYSLLIFIQLTLSFLFQLHQ